MLINNGNAIDGFAGFPTDQAMKIFFSTLDKLCNIVYDEEKIKVNQPILLIITIIKRDFIIMQINYWMEENMMMLLKPFRM